MIVALDPTLLGLGLIVAIGAFVQSSIGFGSAVVAAPFVVMLRPDLMPTSLLVCALVLPMVQLSSGPRQVAWRPVGWALAARLLATPVGVWLVASASADVIALAVGVLILVTVAASLVAVDVRLTPRTAAAAGAISGVSGTAASIGGPFLALTLQHEPPVRVRSTLAVFLLGGTAMAVLGLTLAGEATREQVGAGVSWLPFVVLGHLLAGPVRSRLPARVLRRWVLAFCVVASIGVIARALL